MFPLWSVKAFLAWFSTVPANTQKKAFSSRYFTALLGVVGSWLPCRGLSKYLNSIPRTLRECEIETLHKWPSRQTTDTTLTGIGSLSAYCNPNIRTSCVTPLYLKISCNLVLVLILTCIICCDQCFVPIWQVCSLNVTNWVLISYCLNKCRPPQPLLLLPWVGDPSLLPSPVPPPFFSHLKMGSSHVYVWLKWCNYAYVWICWDGLEMAERNQNTTVAGCSDSLTTFR